MGLIYIFSYLNLVFFYFLNSQSKSRRLWRILLGVLPAVLTVSLRGSVGTDSANYLSFYRNIDNINILNLDVQSLTFEPAFVVMVKFISMVCSDPFFIQSIMSLLCTILLLAGFIKTHKDCFFFVFTFFPNFYFDMTMNGVRYGIAFAIFICISSFFDGSRIGKNLLLLTPFLHVTSIFLIFLSYMEKISSSKLVVIFTSITLSYLFLFSRAEDKFSSYSDYSSPAEVSGTAPLIIIIAASVILFNSCKTKIDFNINVYKMLFIQILFFGLARFSYAGLRLEWLLLSFFSYYLAKSLSSGKLELSKTGSHYFVLLGLLSFIAQYRYYVLEDKSAESPFLPYHFFWQ